MGMDRVTVGCRAGLGRLPMRRPAAVAFAGGLPAGLGRLSMLVPAVVAFVGGVNAGGPADQQWSGGFCGVVCLLGNSLTEASIAP